MIMAVSMSVVVSVIVSMRVPMVMTVMVVVAKRHHAYQVDRQPKAAHNEELSQPLCL